MVNYLKKELTHPITRRQADALWNSWYSSEDCVVYAFPIEISYCLTCEKLRAAGYQVKGLFDPSLVLADDDEMFYGLICVKDGEVYRIPVSRLYVVNWMIEVEYLKEIGVI